MALENIIYTADQLMEIEADTSEYHIHLVPDTVIARLDMKAWMKAKGKLRVFCTCEDGEKIIAFAFSFNGYKGLKDVPVGSWMKLMFCETPKGIFIGDVEVLPEDSVHASIDK